MHFIGYEYQSDIYFIYFMIGYPFSKSRFSKWIIQNIQSKISVYIFG